MRSHYASNFTGNFIPGSQPELLTKRLSRAALPEGITIKCVTTHGVSFWAISRKIDAILPDGQQKSYFAKIYTAARPLDIARGEFESTKQLYDVIPNNVPRAVGYGICAGNPTRSFFLAEFRDMTDELPGVNELVEVVAKIHQRASPTGKFGFPITTFTGKHAVDNAWCDTWKEFFTRVMKDTMKAELETHGPDEELEELSEKILTKVIPRRIRPMETEGRSIKPVLVHGDLWHGNVSVDNETKEPVLYDPCCFYGHYECKCTVSFVSMMWQVLIAHVLVR